MHTYTATYTCMYVHDNMADSAAKNSPCLHGNFASLSVTLRGSTLKELKAMLASSADGNGATKTLWIITRSLI